MQPCMPSAWKKTDTAICKNYICDLDNNRQMELAAISSYADSTEDVPGETLLKIVKLEEGTETPLEGAVFSVVDPEGGRKVGSFQR